MFNLRLNKIAAVRVKGVYGQVLLYFPEVLVLRKGLAGRATDVKKYLDS